MPVLTTKTFVQLVQAQAAAIQSRAAGLVDFGVGSILRAVSEAFSGTALWLQGLILALLKTTRLSTAEDADADSFVADFGAAPLPGDPTVFARLPAAQATGLVTFSRLSTSGQANVPVGATVQSLDGSQRYLVTLDTGNAAYNPAFGYVMAGGTATVTVPVQAVVAGSAGNAVAGAINTITSAITGVDRVVNGADFTNGADAETTAAMRIRWRQFVQALRRATPAALAVAASSLRRGMTCKPVENVHRDGTVEKGFTYLVVDDGTGTPSSDLLTAAAAAVDLAHAAGTSFAVYAPNIVNINVSAALVVGAGVSKPPVILIATQALRAFLNALPVGQTVYWSRIWQVLHDSSPDIVEITGLSVNGGTADIAIAVYEVAKANTLTIT